MNINNTYKLINRTSSLACDHKLKVIALCFKVSYLCKIWASICKLLWDPSRNESSSLRDLILPRPFFWSDWIRVVNFDQYIYPILWLFLICTYFSSFWHNCADWWIYWWLLFLPLKRAKFCFKNVDYDNSEEKIELIHSSDTSLW
jgi:hypothetical protein